VHLVRRGSVLLWKRHHGVHDLRCRALCAGKWDERVRLLRPGPLRVHHGSVVLCRLRQWPVLIVGQQHLSRLRRRLLLRCWAPVHPVRARKVLHRKRVVHVHQVCRGNERVDRWRNIVPVVYTWPILHRRGCHGMRCLPSRSLHRYVRVASMHRVRRRQVLKLGCKRVLRMRHRPHLHRSRRAVHIMLSRPLLGGHGVVRVQLLQPWKVQPHQRRFGVRVVCSRSVCEHTRHEQLQGLPRGLVCEQCRELDVWDVRSGEVVASRQQHVQHVFPRIRGPRSRRSVHPMQRWVLRTIVHTVLGVCGGQVQRSGRDHHVPVLFARTVHVRHIKQHVRLLRRGHVLTDFWGLGVLAVPARYDGYYRRNFVHSLLARVRQPSRRCAVQPVRGRPLLKHGIVDRVHGVPHWNVHVVDGGFRVRRLPGGDVPAVAAAVDVLCVRHRSVLVPQSLPVVRCVSRRKVVPTELVDMLRLCARVRQLGSRHDVLRVRAGTVLERRRIVAVLLVRGRQVQRR
jgi:hypothetical protein